MLRVSASAARPFLAFSLLLSVLGPGLAWSAPLVGSINFTLGGRSLLSADSLTTSKSDANDWNLSNFHVDGSGDTVATSVKQPALGLEVTLGRANWPVQIAMDILYSSDDGVQDYPPNSLFDIPLTRIHQRASVLELGVGARRAWTRKGITPYIGGGFSMFRADLASEMIDPSIGRWGGQIDAVGERQWASGFWFGGGIYKTMGPRFQMGLTARFSKAEVEFTQRGDVVGNQGGYVFVPHTGSDKFQVGGRHIGVVVGWTFPNRK